MSLIPEEIDIVLNYPAFEAYDEEQKKTLKEKLGSTHLTYPQVALLFSDDINGGIIHDLVEDSQNNDESARQLGKIIANVRETISPDYGPTPIIQNLISRSGPYNESIVQDIKALTKKHVEVHDGRIIEYTQPVFQVNDIPVGEGLGFMGQALHFNAAIARLFQLFASLPADVRVQILREQSDGENTLLRQAVTQGRYAIGFFLHPPQNQSNEDGDNVLDNSRNLGPS